MKKIFYLIPLFLLFLIPKAYALPDCTLVSNATLYDVNSATSVSSISTNKDSELLCNTIHSAYGSSDESHGLGWSIDLTSINNGNSYYQLDVFMYSQVPDAGRIPIINSSFRNNYISVGTSNPASLWANGTTNVTDLNYNLSTYYDMTSGRTYEVISYIFKSNVNFNKIFVPFATYGLYSGYFDLIGISLTNTGQSSLTETEIDNLFSNQTNNLKNDINTSIYNTEENIINNQNQNAEQTNGLLGTCYKNIFDITNYTYSSTRYSKIDYVNQYAVTLVSNGDYTGGTFPLIYHLELKPSTTYYFKKGDSEVVGSASAMYYIYRGSPSGTLVHYTNDLNNFSFTTSATNFVDYYFQVYLTGTQKEGDKFIFQRPMLFEKNNYSGAYIPYDEQVCTSKIDSTNDKLDSVNDSINDLNSSINDSNSSGATDSAGNFFNNFEDNDFGLSGIITAPLNTIKTITSNSCTPINLTIPFVNKNMTLPCMTDIYEEHFGGFLDIYQIITFGIISYWVCVQIYAMVKGFKNPDKDEIEVMDL